jgi:hypothetical protein
VTNEHLWADLVREEGVHEDRSSFKDAPSLWVDSTEVAHWDDDKTLDIRLTRAVIRARRPEFRADPRVKLRQSSSADWLELGIRGPGDHTFALELLREAVDAHRPTVDNRPPS